VSSARRDTPTSVPVRSAPYAEHYRRSGIRDRVIRVVRERAPDDHPAYLATRLAQRAAEIVTSYEIRIRLSLQTSSRWALCDRNVVAPLILQAERVARRFGAAVALIDGDTGEELLRVPPGGSKTGGTHNSIPSHKDKTP
jgi:hypothetical protein